LGADSVHIPFRAWYSIVPGIASETGPEHACHDGFFAYDNPKKT
jgi:hypothetical protein